MSESWKSLDVCPYCGASPVTSSECWLCQESLVGVPARSGEANFAFEETDLESVRDIKRRNDAWKPYRQAGAILLLILFGLIFLGMAVNGEWGAITGLVILFVPAAVHTIFKSGRRTRKGEEVTLSNTVLTFFLSAVVTYGVLMLLFIGLMIALFAICMVAVMGAGGAGFR